MTVQQSKPARGEDAAEDFPVFAPGAEPDGSALDTPPEAQFDRVVGLARVLFDMPIDALMLLDRRGRWYKASSGTDAEQAAHEVSFCECAMECGTAFIVLDAEADKRFAETPKMVAEAKIRFCAGAPLCGAGGQNMGAMCIVSSEPRDSFSAVDQSKLDSLAEIVCLGIELNRHVRQARTAASEQIRALREANARIKNSVNYATLLAEVESADIPTEKLTIVGLAAWRQYTEAGGVLSSSMRSLRDRVTTSEYRQMVELMPGFAV
jgi:hypothetical protein